MVMVLMVFLQLERSNYEECAKKFGWKILRDKSTGINISF